MTDDLNEKNEAVDQPYDAHVLAEEIAKGEEKAPKVNVEADYEASKQFSQSEIDQTEAGAEAAAAATAPKLEVPKPAETTTSSPATGDPAEFLDMAKDVNPQLQA